MKAPRPLWWQALRLSRECARLRGENTRLRVEAAQLTHRCEVLSDKLEKALRDLSIVRLCARDRAAVDDFLADAEHLSVVEDPSAFGEDVA